MKGKKESERERERQKEGKRREARDRTLAGACGFFFLCSQALFVKAAFRVTGLAQSASAVTGNYKQAKCVTCPNAVVESLKGHRAHAGWLHAGFFAW